MEAPLEIQRVHRTITSSIERRLLVAIAERLPAWVTPDRLTVFGFLAAIGIAASYFAARYSLAYLHLANLGWVLHWFADSLDGTLARVRGQERPRYGHYVDRFTDTLSSILIMLGVAYSGLAHPTSLYLFLASYLFLLIHTFLWAAVKGVVRISYSLLGPTEERILLILLNVWILAAGNSRILTLGQTTLSIVDSVAIGLAAFFLTTTLVSGIRSIRELRRLGA